MNKSEYELHVFIESLYNDIRECYSKNIQEKFVHLCSIQIRENTVQKKKYIYIYIYIFAAVSCSDDKRMQSIHSIETYVYGTSKDLLSGKEEIECNNIIKRYKYDYL